MLRQLLVFNSVSTCCNYTLLQSGQLYLVFIGQDSKVDEGHLSIYILVIRRGWGRSCLVPHKNGGCRRGAEAGHDIMAGLGHHVKPKPILERYSVLKILSTKGAL